MARKRKRPVLKGFPAFVRERVLEMSRSLSGVNDIDFVAGATCAFLYLKEPIPPKWILDRDDPLGIREKVTPQFSDVPTAIPDYAESNADHQD